MRIIKIIINDHIDDDKPNNNGEFSDNNVDENDKVQENNYNDYYDFDEDFKGHLSHYSLQIRIEIIFI